MMLLEIKNLRTYFYTDSGIVKAVDGASLSVEKGEVVAIVGGSGSGKTVLALSVLRLVSEPGHIVGGEIIYKGTDLTKLEPRRLQDIRGKGISMIFQEPMTSLNPIFTIGNQIVETILVHGGYSSSDPKPAYPEQRRGVEGESRSEKNMFSTSSNNKKLAREYAMELLSLVGIPEPKSRMGSYPHEMSGGMRQRVMIAMALACKPDILIADEPTTALDVTIQAQILDLLGELQARLGMAVLLITHDFGIVAQTAQRVYVMHDGKIVESGGVENIFKRPEHEYTKKLLAAVPVL